jgi:two-component system sensor histidine kinase and response regulator WspE
MEFLFLPGFSLKDRRQRHVRPRRRLDVVHEAVQRQNGTCAPRSTAGRAFPPSITLPLTQSIVRALVVEVLGEAYALPIARVERVLRVPAARSATLSGPPATSSSRASTSAWRRPAQVLDLGDAPLAHELAVIVIGTRERYGLVVDAMRGEQSLTVQPLEPTFGKLRDVASCALLDDGAPALILDVPDMLLSIARLLGEGALQPAWRRRPRNSGPRGACWWSTIR